MKHMTTCYWCKKEIVSTPTWKIDDGAWFYDITECEVCKQKRIKNEIKNSKKIHDMEKKLDTASKSYYNLQKRPRTHAFRRAYLPYREEKLQKREDELRELRIHLARKLFFGEESKQCWMCRIVLKWMPNEEPKIKRKLGKYQCEECFFRDKTKPSNIDRRQFVERCIKKHEQDMYEFGWFSLSEKKRQKERTWIKKFCEDESDLYYF
tara:strand:+ start:443 stop:1066 length:624 start_codon:yes stop_codon:yes gene_type:complete